MSAITDAAMLPRLPDSTNTFADVANANAVTDEGIQNIVDNAKQQKQEKIAQAPFGKIVHKFNPKTGKYDVDLMNVSADSFDYLGNLLQTGQATMQAFGEARAQLQAKRQFQEQHPIISAVGKIASVSAAQYAGGGRGRDISPIVRAAGAFGLEQFGQTNAELSQQEAQLTGQQFGVAKALYGEQQQDQVIKNAEARNRVLDKRDQDRFLIQYRGQLRQEASQGLLSAADAPRIADELVQAGAVSNTEQAKSMATGLVASSEAANRIKALESQDKRTAEDARQLAMDRRFLAAQSGINSRFAEVRSEKKIEEATKDADRLLIAQGIANGDPTSLKVASVRGAQGGSERLKLLADVKRINPSLSEADINARVKAVESLGSQVKGSFGAQLSSIDTFSQHAGEVLPAMEKLNNLGTPILNTAINKLKANVKGDPAVGPVLVAIAQVGKEYETFLNSGFALQEQDRLQVEKLLNGDMNLLQTKAVLQQFMKTARDRYISMDNQYHRTTTRHFPSDVISPEGRASAERLGITLPDLSASTDRAASGNPVARAPQGTPDGPIQYKGKPAVVSGGVIYAQ